jgi:biotin operon repressor
MKSNLWKIVSLLVPVPEAYAVGMAINDVLHWWIGVVIISSAIVALTGFLAIDTTNRMSEYNDTLYANERQDKMHAPTWRGFMVLAIWFVGVMLLTVFLKVSPILATWTPLGLVVVGSSAAWLRSINMGQEAREQMRAQAREQAEQARLDAMEADRQARELARNERKASRKARQEEARKQASARQAISASLQAKNASGKALAEGHGDKKLDANRLESDGMKSGTRRGAAISDEQLILEYQMDPTVSSSELASKLGVSRQAIDQRRDRLADAGLLDITRDARGRVMSVDVALTVVGRVGQGS